MSGALLGLIKGRKDGADLPQRVLQRVVRLKADEVLAYAEVCGFQPAQGVPMTWPHILAFPLHIRILMDKDFPYPAMGLIHLDNRIRQHARLRIGDRLTLTTRTGALFAHEKGQAFTLETVAEREGQTIWESTSTYLKRGVVARGEMRPDLTGGEADRLIEIWKVEPDLARRYARISGDANPIHTSALGARLLGFPRALIHGMWTKARAVSALIPQGLVDVAEVEVAFRAPLFLPGQAGLYAGPEGVVRDFEVRDAAGARAHLRGRISLNSGDAF